MNRLAVFIDESGQRATTPRSSDHFVMAAVITPDSNLPSIAIRHEQLRAKLGRQPGDPLHWTNLRSHGHRVVASQSVAEMPVKMCAVVVCKRHLTGLPDEVMAYLFTLRLLLERVSWFARSTRTIANYTLSHIVRFKLEQLRDYERRLRNTQCSIEWEHMDPAGGRIDQPTRVEQLQLADIAASAIAKAFEPDDLGVIEGRYIRELAPALWRGGTGVLTSYGLKMHPWNAVTQARYPWVAAL